jgi:hypothetical protein
VGPTGEEEIAKQRTTSPQLWTDIGTIYHAPEGPSRQSGRSERPNLGTGLGLPPLLRIASSGWQTAAEIFDLRLDVNAQGSPQNMQGATFVRCGLGSRRTSGLAFHGCGGVEFAHVTTIEVLLSVMYAFAGVRSRSRLAGEREQSEPRREPSPWKRSTRKVSLCLTFSVAVQQ